MQQSVISENFSEFGGLDYRSNSVTRKPRFAKDARNVFYLKNNSISTRPGTKGIAAEAGGGGTKTYYYRDADNLTQSELITIDNNLHRRVSGSITLTYNGTEENVIFSIIPVETSGVYTYKAILTEADVEVYSLDLGTGVDEASSVTIATLVSGIDALADYTCTSIGTTTGPAAFLPTTLLSLTIATATDVDFYYWEQIYCPLTDPFQDFFDEVTGQNGELAALFNHNNRLYIGTGFNPLYKYDGVSCFRAGMPFTETLSVASTAGPGLTGDYQYFITYEQVDARSVLVEGDISNLATVTLANQKGRLTIPQIQPTTGFLTSCGIVNGNQGPVTSITIDSGHTLQVGQTVFFLDNTGAEQTRVIETTTATTFTFTGATSVLDNQVISANLKINIWRNTAGQTELFYLVKTIPNNSLTATVTYDDDLADSSLEILFEFPVEGHGEPPENMKYITSYNGLLILANGQEAVWFSDIDGPEYFNLSFNIRSKSNKLVTGVGANKDALYVFKEDEGHVLTGSLATSQYRLQELSASVGCSSYHSIIDVEGTLWFYSKYYGPRRVVSSNLPDDISFRILPVITRKTSITEEQIAHNRVIAYNVGYEQIVLFYCPTETENSGVYYPNDNSFTLVADYRAQAEEDVEYDEQGKVTMRVPKIRWWKWDNINLGGGGDIIDDAFVYTEKRLNSTTSALEYPLCELLQANSEYDVHDHAQPIPWVYESGWTDLNNPDLLKKFISIAVYSFPEFIATAFSVVASTEKDFIDGIVHSTKTLEFGTGGVSTGYGTDPYGDSSWGDPLTPKVIFPLRLTKATCIKLTFEKDLFLEKPVISGWSIQANPAFSPKIQR